MLALLTEQYPKEVLLIGCQPEELEDYGGSLRPSVKLSLEDALAHGVDTLRRWGGEPVPRRRALSEQEAVTFSQLGLAHYEGRRPTKDEACRVGDVRFFPTSTPA